MEQETIQLLGKIEAAITEAAPQLWEIAVRQALISGYISTAWCVFWALICTVSARAAWTCWELDGRGSRDEYFETALGFMALGIAGSIAFCVTCDNAINALLNPEWEAISLIKELL